MQGLGNVLKTRVSSVHPREFHARRQKSEIAPVWPQKLRALDSAHSGRTIQQGVSCMATSMTSSFRRSRNPPQELPPTSWHEGTSPIGVSTAREPSVAGIIALPWGRQAPLKTFMPSGKRLPRPGRGDARHSDEIPRRWSERTASNSRAGRSRNTKGAASRRPRTSESGGRLCRPCPRGRNRRDGLRGGGLI